MRSSAHAAFGKYIRDQRTRRSITLTALADNLGIAKTYLSDLERGRRAAPIKKLGALADNLNLTPAQRDYMYDLAALTRPGSVPYDLVTYIRETDAARTALRRARDANLTNDDWQKILTVITTPPRQPDA